jgi:hypothetical protein
VSTQDRSAPSRPWLIALPTAVLVVLGAIWSGLWFYASNKAEATLATWRAREADAGRVYGCANESFGGYPFRIEIDCAGPSVDDRNMSMAIRARNLAAVAQVWDPTLVNAEIAGPVTVAPLDGAPNATIDWMLAQASLRGTPRAPERLSVVIEKPVVSQAPAAAAGAAPLPPGGAGPLAKAEHLEFHARFSPDSQPGHAVLDLKLDAKGFTAPALVTLGAPLGALAAAPADASIDALVRGAADSAPKPLPQQLRDLAAGNGRIDITNARLQQGDLIATLSGPLAVTPHGTLNGEFQLVVVNFAKLVPLLGIDRAVAQFVPQDTINRFAPTLDRFLPGLGGILRGGGGGGGGGGGDASKAGGNASAAAVAGAAALGAVALGGHETELEGQRAIALTLRIDDGAVYLGPLKVGQIPPLK